MKSLRCLLGHHRWTAWKLDKKDLLRRRCERCGKGQVRYPPIGYLKAKLIADCLHLCFEAYLEHLQSKKIQGLPTKWEK